ncbi:MAG: NAD-dependent epimerase/dehydratase family protein [Pseudoxanthomonas sp.]
MNLLVTGANGFIGKALVRRLLAGVEGLPVRRLALLDVRLDPSDDPRVRALPGDLADTSVQQAAFAEPMDAVFHLASIPGGMAEQDYALARRVNLDAVADLLDRAAAQAKPPVFVFASSIAALGAPLPAQVDDRTPLRPGMSYGAQKQIGEILVQDFSLRGKVDGRCVRLPGIVMRPPARTGQLSAFMSDLIRELHAGRPYTCPVSPQATLWLMSLQRIVDNLIHAALLDPARLAGGDSRAWTLPALHLSIAELAAAAGRVGGHPVESLLDFRPDPKLEAAFGAYPPLSTPAADALGFLHDGDADSLVRRAIASANEAIPNA